MQKILLLCFFVGSGVFALDNNKCSELRNRGVWKTYKYQGLGEKSAVSLSTKEGTTKASSGWTSETPTASVDPLFLINLSTVFPVQYSSSWGACALIGFNYRNESLKEYIALNNEEIFKEVAQGSGEHLEVLSYMSLCKPESSAHFNDVLQKHYSGLEKHRADAAAVLQEMDLLLKHDSQLNSDCEVTKYL